jgi:hypothetical protein
VQGEEHNPLHTRLGVPVAGIKQDLTFIYHKEYLSLFDSCFCALELADGVLFQRFGVKVECFYIDEFAEVFLSFWKYIGIDFKVSYNGIAPHHAPVYTLCHMEGLTASGSACI